MLLLTTASHSSWPHDGRFSLLLLDALMVIMMLDGAVNEEIL